MTDLLAYLIILLGFITSLTLILSANPKISGWLIQFLKMLFLLHIVFYCIRILCLPFHRIPLLAQILHSAYIVSYSFYAGAFASYWVVNLLFVKRLQVTKNSLLQQTPVLYKILTGSASALFIYSSTASIFYYAKSLHFFIISGYSEAFFIFILAVEFIGGVCLLYQKTALYAALLLMCDMLGALYTHYHNYFTKQLPDPLGNSIPSLITQTVLISIIIITFYPNKTQILKAVN
jgi:hypothetical protein